MLPVSMFVLIFTFTRYTNNQNTFQYMSRKLRMGMIGGGQGAFIGAIHRFASLGDGQIELVCGALSNSPDKAKSSGRELGLDDSRAYTSYTDMIQSEAALPPETRMDFVSIVTPNHVHFKPAMMALDHGFHVFIEKPMTFTLEEAIQLKEKVKSTGKVLTLAHTYTGYPMVKEARHMIAKGRLGKIRKIYVNYHQGWLSRASEQDGNKQAAWRTDPKRSGKSGAMGDIGVHAFNLAEYISGMKVTHLCAELDIVVNGRALDDDGMVMLKFGEDASGMLTATQVAAGEENALSIKIYGEDGGLEWHQMEPNTLHYRPLEGPAQVLRAGMPYLSEVAQLNTRTPAGHPEGYLEAFANLYRNFTLAVKHREGLSTGVREELIDYTDAEDGIRGMAFIENVVKSSNSFEKWLPFTI